MTFFVTAIAFYPDDAEKRYDKPYKHTATFGHWPDLEGAQKAVERNEGGMDECLYNYLVIEEATDGVYGRIRLQVPDDQSKGEWWYHWEHPDCQEGHLVKMDKPSWSISTIGWSIG